MQPSQSYSELLQKFESISGAAGPGLWTYYWDDAGVATAGFGHALTDALGQIRRSQPGAPVRAAGALQALFGGETFTTAQAVDLKLRDMAAFAAKVTPLILKVTAQNQFDALLDFAYNVGVHALSTSTLIRFHNSPVEVPMGDMDLNKLKEGSQNKVSIQTIGQAFAAWSEDSGHWSLGVFHRRMVEFLMYSGMDYDQAYSTAFAVSD